MVAIVGGAIAAGGAIAGGAMQSSASKKAANAQLEASREANALQKQMFDESKGLLQPYVDFGQGSMPWLEQGLGLTPGNNPFENSELLQKFNPTIEELEQTPGYQFIKDQGLKATQNGYAAKGLANSGAALKGAANFATGLADSTYQQQFQNYWNQNKDIYNMLLGPVGIGANAAAGVGNNAIATGASMAQNTIGGGNAQAAGMVGSASALSNGLTSGVNNALQYNMLQNFLGGTAGGVTPGATGGYQSLGNIPGLSGIGG